MTDWMNPSIHDSSISSSSQLCELLNTKGAALTPAAVGQGHTAAPEPHPELPRGTLISWLKFSLPNLLSCMRDAEDRGDLRRAGPPLPLGPLPGRQGGPPRAGRREKVRRNQRPGRRAPPLKPGLGSLAWPRPCGTPELGRGGRPADFTTSAPAPAKGEKRVQGFGAPAPLPFSGQRP